MRRFIALMFLVVGLTVALVGPAQGASTPAPVMSVSGQTISWSLVRGITRYVFVRKVPGTADAYSTITCSTNPCSTTPAPAPGFTVNYGLRADVNNSQWAREVQITYPLGWTDADRRVAPTLTVNGDNTISWNRVADIDSYVFVTKVPGQADRYEFVPCCSIDPPDWPGQTVNYGARTDFPSSSWATEVQITYAGGPPPPGGFDLGITGAPDWLSMQTLALRATDADSVRLDEARMGTTTAKDAAVANVRAEGARPEILYSTRSESPSTIRADALRYGPNATSTLPMLYVELGNEDSYSYKNASASVAQQYGNQVEAVANALVGTGVKIIPQMDDALIDSTTHWVQNVYSTFPNMDAHPNVGGWVIHPYGPGYMTRINRLVSQAVAQGAPSDFPVMVTEYGLSSDNGRCLSDNYGWNRCMSYAEAASTITSVANDIKANAPEVKLFTIYHMIDGTTSGASTDREMYFGALLRDGTPKPSYANALFNLGH